MRNFLIAILVFILNNKHDVGEAAVHLAKRGSNLDPRAIAELVEYLGLVLENFRKEMKTGIPELDLPSLDPLPVDDKNFKLDDKMASGKLDLKDLFIEGLSTLRPIVHPPEGENINVRFELSSVTALGHYDLDGKAARIFPLYGVGPFTITVNDPTADVSGRFFMVGTRVHFEITSMSFSWHSLHIHLENFLGGGKVSSIVQRVLPVFAKEIFGRMEPTIVGHLKGPLNDRIDREIGNSDIQKILRELLDEDH